MFWAELQIKIDLSNLVDLLYSDEIFLKTACFIVKM